jgi:hypothetical protein
MGHEERSIDFHAMNLAPPIEYGLFAAGISVAIIANDASGEKRRAAEPGRPVLRTGRSPAACAGPPSAHWLRSGTELVKVPAPGRDGDFFALGGHSLLASAWWSGSETTFGRRIAVANLLAHPTIAGLATLIEATTVPSDDLLALLQRQGAKPPVFLLQPHAVQALYQGIRPRRGSGFLCPVLEEIISSSAWRLVSCGSGFDHTMREGEATAFRERKL